MKKHLREGIGFLVILLSLLLFVTSFALAAGDDSAAGKKIFDTKCAQCHGKDGKGVAKMLKVLKVDAAKIDLTNADASKLSDVEMTKLVTDGKKKMPKYKGKLTATQIQDVLQYLTKTIQGRK